MTGRTILIVEDNRDDAELAELTLGELGPEWIHLVHDGAEALAYLLGSGPLPAVVLLDAKLPKVDGFEVLDRLRSSVRAGTVPVVMFTSSDTAEDIARAAALGANSYVCEPIEYGAYRTTVTKLGRYWLDMNLGTS